MIKANNYKFNTMEERIYKEAELFLRKYLTVREVAKELGVSKSTVHKDLSERLEKLNPILYDRVRNLLEYNKAVRHIRGGESTRKKYIK